MQDKHITFEANLEPEEPIIITRIVIITTTHKNGSILILNAEKEQASNINPYLVKIIAKSYYWNKLLNEGKVKNSQDIQTLENLTDNSYIKDALGLRILSPRIVESILKGTQPPDLSIKKLLKVKTLDWQEQEKIINFV